MSSAFELATYAAHDDASRGRMHAEASQDFRGVFQHDRDRIVHSTAFRRLVYKTQVFVNHEGDLYRTRLTHTIEVAQIARTIAQALRLNESLTEAICLAHDLGHTAFGHAGQDALNECMQGYGGFEHNLQSLRVVDELEERYAEFPGLNLTFETREGILKHCSLNNARMLGPLGERFIKRHQPSLEAQVANIADEIAYNNHDVDDGLRAGLITIDELCAVQLFRREHDAVCKEYPALAGRRLLSEINRRMINHVVADLISNSEQHIREAAPATIDDVRQRSNSLIGLSTAVAAEHLELKDFLRHQVYRHYRVLRMTTKARKVIQSLFTAFFETPELMPPDFQRVAAANRDEHGDQALARAVADYIAGMTDRYAILEYERVFNPAERS